jgi:hypothetical protein
MLSISEVLTGHVFAAASFLNWAMATGTLLSDTVHLLYRSFILSVVAFADDIRVFFTALTLVPTVAVNEAVLVSTGLTLEDGICVCTANVNLTRGASGREAVFKVGCLAEQASKC